MITINLKQTIVGKSSFDKLNPVPVPEEEAESGPPSIEELMSWIDILFYLIPKDQLKELMEKIADYLGVQLMDESLEDILKELTELREQVSIDIKN